MVHSLVAKSVAFGVLFFLFDLSVYLYALLGGKKKLAKNELAKTKAKIGFIIPIVLFIQVFFAFILVYTYKFLMAFRLVKADLTGSFSYAFIFFVPMLYLLLNSWLWGDKDFNNKLMPSMLSWLIKFALTGLFLGVSL